MNKTTDFYLMKTVAEDLDFLMNKWNEEINDVSLRNSSAILRRLLLDGDGNRAYRTAWQKIGFQGEPRIIAVDSDELIFGNNEEIPVDKIEIAVAGGAKYNGGIIEGFRFLNFASTPNEVKRNYERRKFLMEHPKEYKLHKYLKKTALVVKGTKFTHYDIIDYISNKLGGVHIDLNRSRQKDDKFKVLDESISLQILDKDYIYYQLLSIGQALAQSDDAKRFVDKAKSIGLINKQVNF